MQPIATMAYWSHAAVSTINKSRIHNAFGYNYIVHSLDQYILCILYTLWCDPFFVIHNDLYIFDYLYLLNNGMDVVALVRLLSIFITQYVSISIHNFYLILNAKSENCKFFISTMSLYHSIWNPMILRFLSAIHSHFNIQNIFRFYYA